MAKPTATNAAPPRSWRCPTGRYWWQEGVCPSEVQKVSRAHGALGCGRRGRYLNVVLGGLLIRVVEPERQVADVARRLLAGFKVVGGMEGPHIAERSIMSRPALSSREIDADRQFGGGAGEVNVFGGTMPLQFDIK